jgi:hypothetical protein
MHLHRFKVNLIYRWMEIKAQGGLRPSFRRNLRQNIFAGEAIRKKDCEEFVTFSLGVPFFGFDHRNRMRSIGNPCQFDLFQISETAPETNAWHSKANVV